MLVEYEPRQPDDVNVTAARPIALMKSLLVVLILIVSTLLVSEVFVVVFHSNFSRTIFYLGHSNVAFHVVVPP